MSRTAPTPAVVPTQLGLFDIEPAPAPWHSSLPEIDPPHAGAEISGIGVQAALLPSFLHPQTSRRIHLAGHEVGYALRRARRRTIGFVVGQDGLSVSAPRWVGVGDIEAALRERGAWILRKLAQAREQERRRLELRVHWRDGATVAYLGAPLRVVLDATAEADPEAASAPHDDLHATHRVLRLALPPLAVPAQIRDAVQAWLQRRARSVFEERCEHFAQRLGVRVQRLALSSAATRWGSANANGSIRLNWRLIHFGLPTIDYVVVHELAHLRHMDHSPRFWDVVGSVVPDYRQRRRTLEHTALPDLG